MPVKIEAVMGLVDSGSGQNWFVNPDFQIVKHVCVVCQ